MADQDVLAAGQVGAATDGHLAVAVQSIFDIARDIDGQVAENGDGAAIARDKETVRCRANGVLGTSIERSQADQACGIRGCVGYFDPATKSGRKTHGISCIIADGKHVDIGERYDARAAFLNLDCCGSAGSAAADTGHPVDAA